MKRNINKLNYKCQAPHSPCPECRPRARRGTRASGPASWWRCCTSDSGGGTIVLSADTNTRVRDIIILMGILEQEKQDTPRILGIIRRQFFINGPV